MPETQDRDLSKPVLAVLGLSPTGLYVIREAAKTGARVRGFSDVRECAAVSRYLDNKGKDTVVDQVQLSAALNQLAEQHAFVGVIPTTDRHVEWLCRNGETLPSNVRFGRAYTSGAAELALDKARLVSMAHGLGIKTPSTCPVGPGGEYPEGADFPFLLKPRSIHRQRNWLRGRKLFVIRRMEDWRAATEGRDFSDDEWTVQSLVAGPESNIRVAAVWRGESGETEVYTARKLRQYPINFGSASLLVPEDNDEVARLSVQLLEAMDFNGIAGVEFKLDADDGCYRLIEVNPRPSLWFSSATQSGSWLVRRQLLDWFGDFDAAPVPNGRPAAWRYGVKDFAAAMAHRRGGSLPAPDVTAGAGLPTHWAVYSGSDPGPALQEVRGYVGKLFRRRRV